MAFDHEKHALDQQGWQIDKKTGRRIGLDPAPHPSTDCDPEYPKWIVPHDSHFIRVRVDGVADRIEAPGWEHVHVARDGVVTIMVADADREKLALAPVVKNDPPPA